MDVIPPLPEPAVPLLQVDTWVDYAASIAVDSRQAALLRSLANMGVQHSAKQVQVCGVGRCDDDYRCW